MSSNNTIISISEWNDIIVLDVIFLILYIVLGIIGNTIVILVYSFQMKNVSFERYFIPFLAASDLTASVTCSTLLLVWDFTQGILSNNLLCSSIYFLLGITTITSVLLLLCVAIQRYLKVCKHFFLTLKWRRLMIVTSVIIAVSCSVPFLLTYGIVEYQTSKNSSEVRCGKLKSNTIIDGGAYAIALGSCATLAFLSFISLYGRIGYEIFIHFKTNDTAPVNLSRRLSITSLSTDLGCGEGKGSQSKRDEILNTDEANTCDEATVQAGESDDNKKPDVTEKHTLPAKNETGSNSEKITTLSIKTISQKRRNRKLKYKFTIMFMVITFVFLICFSPITAILILEGMYPYFWLNLSKQYVPFVLWLYHLFIVNNVINPFIYAFMDSKFHNAVKNLFQNCTSKWVKNSERSDSSI